jgi:hypothetical protein
LILIRASLESIIPPYQKGGIHEVHRSFCTPPGARRVDGVALVAAGFLGARPLSAAASSTGTDGDVVLGVDGQSTSGNTGVTTSGSIGLDGVSTASMGVGVRGDGYGGVYGNGDNTGVEGVGGSIGVFGTGPQEGVLGSGATYGVEGVTDTAAGVYGHTSGQTGIGVWGKTDGVSPGVFGQATSTGIGVEGYSDKGTGVRAESAGTALAVQGIATFSRSGVAKVQAGNTSVRVSGLSLTSSSLVLATIQGDFKDIWVRGVVTNPGAGTFTILLNAPAPAKVPVAWFVLN